MELSCGSQYLVRVAVSLCSLCVRVCLCVGEVDRVFGLIWNYGWWLTAKMLKLTCSVGLDACVQEQHTHLVSSSSSSLSWLFWKDCYLLSLAVTQIATHITIISMLLHISLHGCFRLICSVFLDLLTQIEGSTFGGWLCDLMHKVISFVYLCVFVHVLSLRGTL